MVMSSKWLLTQLRSITQQAESKCSIQSPLSRGGWIRKGNKMPSLRLSLVLGACTVVMCAIMLLQMKWYKIPLWKSTVSSVLLMAAGLSGAMLMYYVENGSFGGRSLFGSIFLTPIVFLPVAWILKIKYVELLDICAPNICMTLAVTKVQCMVDRCCIGRILYQNESYIYIRFPSQLVEMAVFLLLMVALLVMCKFKRFRGVVYPWFLVLYSIPRFVLSYMRELVAPFCLGLPAGAFWSVCALLLGAVWLIMIAQKKDKNRLLPKIES